MPTTLKESLVRGASYELTLDTRRLLVPCKLSGVDIAGAEDREVLVKAVTALSDEHGIQMGDALSATYPHLILSRMRVLPVIEKHGRDVWVELEYLFEPEEFLPTTYIIRDATVAVQRETYYIPGTSTVIKAGFTAASGSDVEGGGAIEEVKNDLLKMRVWMPARSIVVTALRAGRTSTPFQSKQCYVNDNTWPAGQVTLGSSLSNHLGELGASVIGDAAESYPKGYWLLSGCESTWNQQTSMTLISAQATTQVVEDWSVILFVENRTTGKRPFGAYTAAKQDELMGTLTGAAYSRGLIASVNGAVRVGPYPTANFQALFGF